MPCLDQEQIAGTLDSSTFPYVGEGPVNASRLSAPSAGAAPPPSASLRSARPQWTSNRTKRVVDAPKQRILVFMAGGATYSEVRSVYKVAEATNKDVFLGTSHLITPQRFVTDLSNLVRGGGGSSHLVQQYQPLIKGKALPPRPTGMPQDAIDQRYPQQVQPPPAPAPTAEQQQGGLASSRPDLKRPSTLVAGLKRAGSMSKASGSSSLLSPGASLQQSPSASSSIGGQSLNGSMNSDATGGSAEGKPKKKGFFKRLL